uniref:recombinase family protein n=1 Tax=uncultured Bacteroides sp. TaxID=162156 RepID=UPI00272BE804
RTMSTNIKWAYQKRFKDGQVLINPCTLGYKKEGDEYAIVEEEAEIIRMVFRNYLAGDSVRQIADSLNAEGYVTRKGHQFKPNSILNILANEKYTGNAILGKTFKPDVLSKHRVKNEGQAPSYYVENSHPAIISQELFDMVQAEKERRKNLRSTVKTGKGKYSRKYVLSGLLVCANCGAKFRRNGRTVASGEFIPTWVCITHQKDQQSCKMRPLKEKDIYAAYERAVKRLLGETDGLMDIIKQTTLEGMNIEQPEDIEEIRKALMQARKAVLDLFKAKRDGDVSLEEYERKYSEFSQQIVDLEEREKNVHAQNLQCQLAQKRLQDAYELIDEARSNCTDKDVMRKLLDAIKVISKHELEFQFNCGIDIKETV